MVELTRLHPLEQMGFDLAAQNNQAVADHCRTVCRDGRRAAADRSPAHVVAGRRDPDHTQHLGGYRRGTDHLARARRMVADQYCSRPGRTPRPGTGIGTSLGGAAVDVSAQRIGLRLSGSRAREVLAKGCSIDLHPRVFVSGSAVQTTVGLAGVILLALSDAG